MDVDAFLEALPSLWNGDPQTADGPSDDRFAALDVPGMTTPNVLATLNLAASCLEAGECYVEIGSYRGLSLLGASLDRRGRFYGIDNFSEWDGDEATCRSNLVTAQADITLIRGDGWEVLRDPPWHERVGVLFYDGRHRFRDQLRIFFAARRVLADDALLVVDDASQRPVVAANRLGAMLPGYVQVFRFDSPFNGEPRWWNGLAAFRFRRSR